MHKRKSANTQLRHTHIHTHKKKKKKRLLFLFSVGICGPLSPIVVLFPEVSMLSYHHCTGRRIFTTFPFFVIIAVLLLCAFMFFVFFFLLFSLYKVQGSFFFFGSYKPESCTVLYYCYLLLPVFCCLFWSSAIFSFIFTNVYFFFFSNVLPFFLVLFLSCHPVFPYSWRGGNCKWQLREMNVVECGRYFFLI